MALYLYVYILNGSYIYKYFYDQSHKLRNRRVTTSQGNHAIKINKTKSFVGSNLGLY